MLEVIKPATEARQCAYVELLRSSKDAKGRPLVAEATVFVSHAWANPFAELVDAVLQSLGGDAALAGKTFFWLDVMTVNQWKHETLPPDWWSTTFAEASAQSPSLRRRDVPSVCVLVM